nr:hypothetical protein [Paenibacillus sp. yr247]
MIPILLRTYAFPLLEYTAEMLRILKISHFAYIVAAKAIKLTIGKHHKVVKALLISHQNAVILD